MSRNQFQFFVDYSAGLQFHSKSCGARPDPEQNLRGGAKFPGLQFHSKSCGVYRIQHTIKTSIYVEFTWFEAEVCIIIHD